MTTMTYGGELVVTSCWCGIAMALPKDLYDYANRSGVTCYCPLGHGWVRADNMAQKLKEATARAEQMAAKAEQLRGLLTDERDQHHRTERRLQATRGVVTRTKRRISQGLCPKCHAHFGNLETHIAKEHPDYISELNA